MILTHGAQKVEIYNDKRAIKSGAVGSTNVEEVRWLITTLMQQSAAWKISGWAYICDISQMQPAAPEVSKELVDLHKQLVISGCKAIAFVEGASFFTAAQAKEHQKQSKAAIQEGHFRTEAEAVKWISTIVK